MKGRTKLKRYITIDGGTTNTRVSLIVNSKCLHTVRLSVGARSCIDHKEVFENELRSAIAGILEKFKLQESDIIRILASGMITCEFGLCELPHIIAPAGIRELHDSMAEVSFPKISSIPFVFVRGVKVDSALLDSVDMMRGEETELMGLMTLCPDISDDECVYVLPGSHSKIVSIDKNGRISDFSTMLTGEMIMSLSQNTILKDAVDLSCEGYDESALFEGFEYAQNAGLNKALFKVRILKNIFKKTSLEVYSFYIGAVLSGEISYIISSRAKNVAIGGKSQLKTATAALLRHYSSKKVNVISDEAVENSTSAGIIAVYEYCADHQ